MECDYISHKSIRKLSLFASVFTVFEKSPNIPTTMAIIAVAGGTGGLGRAIVEAIKARSQHDVKILSRKVS
jgi:hypothetical protein